MENPEEILHSLEEFSKLKPKDIPRELEDYLCFVAKTGDPVYQWGTVKSLFKEKLINVITDFYESCPSVDIPPCPNVEVFNYELMKSFILEKLDTFVAAPFTVQRICELLTTPRREYNRIDKYMRALEKNILVVSTTEPGNRRTAENGEGIVNGLESEHLPETNNSNEINVEEMDDSPVWSRIAPETVAYQNNETNLNVEIVPSQTNDAIHPTFISEPRASDSTCGSSIDSVITCRSTEEQPYVSIEPVASDSCLREESVQESDVTVTITAIPAAVQKRRDSIEPVVSTANEVTEQPGEFVQTPELKEVLDTSSSSSSSSDSIETSLSNEAETAAAESSEPIITAAVPAEDKSELNENTLDDNNDQLPEPSSLIQIPIISYVTIQPNKEADKIPILNMHSEETVDSEDTVTGLNIEQTKTDSETTIEVSTTTSSTTECVESHQQKVICETSPVSKEMCVSSSDEDINLKTDNLDQIDGEIKSLEQNVPEESLIDCSDNTDSNSEIATCDEKQASGEPVLRTIHEFAASSSTIQEPMDIDLGEESCQEPPTSHG